eukprot:NODE_2990_length_1072_cov_144.900293_g605_i1.p1 GENE.NODE_2990_length_1072_cov_144.900293_g605_i1~~NODE_2990_length_1072_cov_144.900293_g605_i1.p1  ORF type:complete len:245 (+),score=55.74 NODE_2990_length_1072_cov_144.900293_g605_i1:130-864(+)
MLVLICSMLAFYMLELAIGAFIHRPGDDKEAQEKEPQAQESDASMPTPCPSPVDGGGADLEQPHEAANEAVSTEKSSAIRPVAFVNLITDALHNFIDGLAIGATFAMSHSSGLATSIAILFHEIPQELGDFAILVAAGLSRPKALLLNLASACVSLIGVIIGLSVAVDAERWILSITAGGFIYMACCDMVPELMGAGAGGHSHGVNAGHLSRRSMNAVSVGGMIIGGLIMWIIAVTEKHPDCEL